MTGRGLGSDRPPEGRSVQNAFRMDSDPTTKSPDTGENRRKFSQVTSRFHSPPMWAARQLNPRLLLLARSVNTVPN